MSMAIRVKNARQRASIAINMLKKNKSFSRKFDDCFEMGDGDEVMNVIIERAGKDFWLAMAIRDKMPDLGCGDYNRRLCDAVEHCLLKKMCSA